MSASSSTIRILMLVSVGVIDWHPQNELASLAGSALHGYAAVMGLDHVLHQRQPQAAALGVVHQGIAGAVKLLKNLLMVFAVDADAAVLHLKAGGAVFALQAHGHAPGVAGILDGVVQQVQQA